MKAVNVVLALLVSLLIGLAVLEGGLRLLGKGPPDTLLEFDPRTGWTKKPNYEYHRSTRGYDVTIRTNEHGLNDDPQAGPEKEPGTFRVLALGDSFTQGFSVDRDHLFVDVLERWWEAEGRPVEIVNAGTEAFDTAQEVAWLEAWGAEYQPDLVLLFPYQNDLYWNSQVAYQSSTGDREKPRYAPDGRRENPDLPAPPEEPWIARTATGKLFGGSADVDPSAHLFDVGGVTVPREFAPLFEHPPAFMEDVRAHTAGALKVFRRVTRQLGAGAIVVPIPDASLYAVTDEDGVNRSVTGRQLAEVAAPWSADRPVDLFLELARAEGLQTLDVRSYFAGRSDEGAELYFDPRHDWHLNADGNVAFATFLRTELDRLDAVPPADDARPMPPPPLERPEGPPFALVLFLALWAGLTGLYWGSYPDEPRWRVPLQVGALLAAVFGIFLGILEIQRLLPPRVAPLFLLLVVGTILGFVVYKLGRRVGTIAELIKAFTLRGHWYLMPLVVVLLTIGSLLVVAASSPLIAPFIYTLF